MGRRRTRTRTVASVDHAAPVSEAATRSFAFRLPTEIRIIIFELADRSCSSTTYLTIVRLSQVCREWRRIIQETTCLWTKLILSKQKGHYTPYTVSDYTFEVEHLQRDCSALSTYLHRSGQRSLCLYIGQAYFILAGTSKKYPDYYALYLKTFIPLLVDFIRRSRIVAFSSSVVIPYNLVVPGPAPTAILDALDNSESLSSLSIAGRWPNGRCLQLFNRLISLEIPDLRPCKDKLSKPVSQLKHLTVFNAESWIDFTDISGELTNLVTLHVNAIPVLNSNEPFDLPPMMTFQHLLRLSITFPGTLEALDRRSAWSILDVLDLPSLTELELDMHRAPPEWASNTLQSFLQRSPLIESLSYTSTGNMTTTLSAILRSATRLKHLRVSVRDTMVFLLELLSETRLCISSSGLNDEDLDIHTHPCVCPRLESLSATHYRSVPVSLMSRFVAARSSQACPPCDGRQRANNGGQLVGAQPQIRHSRTSPFTAHFTVMCRRIQKEMPYMKDPNISHGVTLGFWLNILKTHVSEI